MAPQVVTRSQRRMEKKQAVFLLILILGVSLVSFSLGVMGGRASLKAEEEEPAPERISVKAVIPAAAGEKGEGPLEDSTEDLTFFDTLPAGEQPLGSGINLPPREEVSKAPAAPKAKEATSGKAPEVKKTAAELPPTAAKEEAKVAPQGAWVVQVASFPSDGDANALRDRLTAKGYQATIQQADLKAKGVWYRVVLGPFSSQEAARQEGDRFQTREKTTVLVRRR